MFKINFAFSNADEAARVRKTLHDRFRRSNGISVTEVGLQTERQMFGSRIPIFPKRWEFDLIFETLDLGDKCTRAMTNFNRKKG